MSERGYQIDGAFRCAECVLDTTAAVDITAREYVTRKHCGVCGVELRHHVERPRGEQ